MLKEIDLALSKNSNPSFLVGNSLSLADIAWGTYILKNALSQKNVHRAFYAGKVAEFPRVKHWCEVTI